VIPDVGYEHLSLVLETAESTGVQHTITVTLEGEAEIARILLDRAPPGSLLRSCRNDRQALVLVGGEPGTQARKVARHGRPASSA
jgi:hypothetical protein